MESHGEVGRVHVSKELRDELGSGFSFEDRGEIEVKGKGPMQTFFLLEENARP
jgi:class 3 adenylate cyclase